MLFRRVFPLCIVVLSSLAMFAGCGKTVTFNTSIQPNRIHIVRTIPFWIPNPPPAPQSPGAVDVYNDEINAIDEFYTHVQSLKSYTLPPNAVFACPAAFGKEDTMITFLNGTQQLAQVHVSQEGCIFVSLVGSPQGTYLQVDDLFIQELNALIANPE